MTACERVRLTGRIEVALPPEEAFFLFTASGERAWAEGWDPRFPAPTSDETEPATVFTTSHGGRNTVWTVVRRDAHAAIAYTAVTPGHRASLITITLEPTAQGSAVTVSYDLTSLAPEANLALREFAEHYPQFLDEWRASIARIGTHLPGAGDPPAPRH